MYPHHRYKQEYNAELLKCGICSFTTNNTADLELHLRQDHITKVKEDHQDLVMNVEEEPQGTLGSATVGVKEEKDTLASSTAHANQENQDTLTSPTVPAKEFSCQLCGFQTHRNTNLISHLKRVHAAAGSREEFKCPHCDSLLSSKFSLKSHIKTVHDNVRDFKCSLCPMAFSSNWNLMVSGLPNEVFERTEIHSSYNESVILPSLPFSAEITSILFKLISSFLQLMLFLAKRF